MGLLTSANDIAEAIKDITKAASDELAGLTRDLYAGRITLPQWEVSAAQTIKDAHVSFGVLGAGGTDAMTPGLYGKIGGNLADEYKFLNTFAEKIAAGDMTEAQATAYIQQYGGASQQAYWNSIRETAEPVENNDLPLLTSSPGDGSTQCRGNCNCQIVVHIDGSADVVLGAGESCPDCIARAAGGPYRLS